MAPAKTAKPTTQNPPQQMEKCEVCSVPCATFCATCKKAYYCNVDHQKKHRKQHKLDCFPARLESSPDLGGRCLIASRNIKAGELIFKDKALVSGPSGAEIYFHIICLGCYRTVKGGYKCSSCGWSVCSIKCEKMPQHAHNECKIFRDAQLKPCVLKPYQYDFINFLRSLLLRDHADDKNLGETDPELLSQYKANWEQLLSLESHSEARANNPYAIRLLRETTQFIQETCKLEGRFETKLIDHVVGVWSINSFGANPPAGVKPGHARMATLLFPKLCLAAHNCIPNTHGILHEETKGGKPSYRMELIASLPIREGEQVHTTYANICEGTVERREVLKDHYYFSCTCRRCSSPTEFGTYFSSFKCQSCRNGFFVPEDPLNNEASFLCTEEECGNFRSGMKYSDFIPKINRIRKEINAAEMEYGIEACIEKYEEILETYKGKVLHPNHWLVIDTEFKLMLRTVSYLSKAKKEKQDGMLNRIIELAEHCLRVADVIQPGFNSYRGKILFCLVEGKLKQIVWNMEKNEGFLQDQSENLKTIKKYADDAIQILAREQGCEEKQVTIMLMQNVRTIEQMLEISTKIKI